MTKTAAEDICALVARDHGLPVVVLRTARFFPERDDSTEIAAMFDDANIKANEYLYRRVDIEDVVRAHLLAADCAPALGFAKYIVSATTPFARADTTEPARDAPEVVRRLFRIKRLSTPDGVGRCSLASTASMTTLGHAPTWGGLRATTFATFWTVSSQTKTPGVRSREQ